jgi:hypothetical protein
MKNSRSMAQESPLAIHRILGIAKTLSERYVLLATTEVSTCPWCVACFI